MIGAVIIYIILNLITYSISNTPFGREEANGVLVLIVLPALVLLPAYFFINRYLVERARRKLHEKEADRLRTWIRKEYPERLEELEG